MCHVQVKDALFENHELQASHHMKIDQYSSFITGLQRNTGKMESPTEQQPDTPRTVQAKSDLIVDLCFLAHRIGHTGFRRFSLERLKALKDEWQSLDDEITRSRKL